MDFNEQLQDFRNRVETGLKSMVPLDASTPKRLSDAMLHSLHAGGKRIRPVMLLGISDTGNGSRDPVPAAVAIECLHTYSLIHDDLPSMDDSVLRRGVPTCHIAFDEATAVLAGDALLTLAFEILSTHYANEPQIANRLVMELSRAAGSARLVGGQMDDILLERLEGETVEMDRVFNIEDNKTGALFCACLRMGLILSDAHADQLDLASKLGIVIGRSFQIVDDILDEVGDEAMVGKSLQADIRNKKTTAVTHFGISGAREEVNRLHHLGLQLCEKLDMDTKFLQNLLLYLKNRVY